MNMDIFNYCSIDQSAGCCAPRPKNQRSAMMGGDRRGTPSDPGNDIVNGVHFLQEGDLAMVPPTEALAGVGIVFRCDGAGKGLIVETLLPGSPLEDVQDQVKQGMMLIAIDGTNVRANTPQQIAPLILGPPGSVVQLAFASLQDEVVTVRIQRRAAARP
mmetsp:Transcript_15693/g.36614  ORF Transcript_15693/g.36614 Transcript_15693/m.36614 type:complete len:159 (+) Transcript_15693:99-575(+)